MGEATVKWTTVLVDLLTLSTGGIILLVFNVAVDPFRRGFFCDDESIRYEFKSSTIPNWALYIYTFSIPFVVITLTEYLRNRNSGSGNFLTRPVPLWFISIYRNLIDFLFGCASSQLVTDIGKYSIGRLRPNFISVCQPNIDLSDCSRYENLYIENYQCQKSNDDAKESRVSFPSGHSSFSAFTMLYVAIYIQVRWGVHNRSTLRLLKSGVQLSLMLLSYYTALSRVMDNKHHWTDVSAGALIGVVAASLTARYVSGLIGPRKEVQNGEAESVRLRSAHVYRPSDAQQNDVEAARRPKEQSVVMPPSNHKRRGDLDRSSDITRTSTAVPSSSLLQDTPT